jgi:hypothetical protein
MEEHQMKRYGMTREHLPGIAELHKIADQVADKIQNLFIQQLPMMTATQKGSIRNAVLDALLAATQEDQP